MGGCPLISTELASYTAEPEKKNRRYLSNAGDTLASCLEGGCPKQDEQKSRVQWHD